MKLLLIFYIYIYIYIYINIILFILKFKSGSEYPSPEYPRTTDPDKDNKIIDPPNKDTDTLKFSKYPIRSRPTISYKIKKIQKLSATFQLF